MMIEPYRHRLDCFENLRLFQSVPFPCYQRIQERISTHGHTIKLIVHDEIPPEIIVREGLFQVGRRRLISYPYFLGHFH